jgi:hypothetical protein
MLEEIAKDTKLAYGEFAQKHFTATKPSATGRTGHLYAATLKDVQRQMQSLDRWQGVLADVDYGPIEQRAMAHASYAGMPVTLDINMTDSVIDWSRVRSPSRARRRQRNGKRKHWPMKYVAKQEVFKVGNRIIMHPEMWERLKRELGVMEHARP